MIANGTLSVDYDLQVLTQDNVVIATSAGHVEPFEDIDFTINESGLYRFRVTLFALQNTGLSAEIGFAVNSDN